MKNLPQQNCMSFLIFILGMICFPLTSFSQVITNNQNAVGMEHNLLFNAVKRFTVSQSGNAQVDLNALFNGNFQPSYSNTALQQSSPTVILIEGLPNYHVQTGAWVGWSTRYWAPSKFKIEVYNNWSGNTMGWITIADYSNTPYNGLNFNIALPQISLTSLKFTFYEGTGDGGRFGLSEIWYLHPEATTPYDGLFKYDEGTTGTMNVGTDNGSTSGYGSKLNFLGASENTDPLNISRYNSSANNSELRVNIGDDLGQAGDKFVVGMIHCSDAQWHPLLTVQADKQIIADGKIIATEIQVKQNVWADFVFTPTYKLRPLSEVEQFIKTNGHLPEIPKAEEVQQNGVNLGEMQTKLLQKVEELTLYTIEMGKKLLEESQKNAKLEQRLADYAKEMKELKELLKSQN